MSDDNYSRRLPFRLEGRFLGFIGETPFKRKYMRVVTEKYDLQIKLAKELGDYLPLFLQTNDLIQVIGEQKLDLHTGRLKLKAHQVNQLGCNLTRTLPDAFTLPCQPEIKILVCQKSGCRKRGGTQLCRAIETALNSRGLQERVRIEETSCQKRCSSGPNLVLIPGRTCISRMHPEAIASLVEKLSKKESEVGMNTVRQASERV